MNEDEIDEAELALWNRMLVYVRTSAAWQRAIQLALVLGGSLLAAVAQYPFKWSDHTKIMVGVSGAGMAFVGGILLVWLNRDFEDLVSQTRTTLRQLRAATRSFLRAEQDKAALDRSLRTANQLIITFDQMIQYLERSLGVPNATVDQKLNAFVTSSAPLLIGPMGLGGSYQWTISVFLRRLVEGEEMMIRVASNWADRDREAADTRAWRYGKGWTGMAWMRAASGLSPPYVVEADTSTEAARARYDTEGQEDLTDYARFRSVAAVPVQNSVTGAVEGVITATSSRLAAFHIERDTPGLRNLETLISFALMVGVIVSGPGPGRE